MREPLFITVTLQIREVLTPFQCTYLARSLNRLLDPVNIAFPGKTVPSTSEMESIVRLMVSELTAARGDNELKSKKLVCWAKGKKQGKTNESGQNYGLVLGAGRGSLEWSCVSTMLTWSTNQRIEN